MRNFSRILLFALLTVSITALSQSKDELAITAAATRLHEAMIKLDAETMDNLTSPLLTYGHSSGAIEDKPDYIKNVIAGPTFFTSIDMQDQWIRLTGKTALMRFNMVGKTKTNDVPADLKLKILYVWTKEKGDWVLLARQALK